MISHCSCKLCYILFLWLYPGVTLFVLRLWIINKLDPWYTQIEQLMSHGQVFLLSGAQALCVNVTLWVCRLTQGWILDLDIVFEIVSQDHVFCCVTELYVEVWCPSWVILDLFTTADNICVLNFKCVVHSINVYTGYTVYFAKEENFSYF